MVIILSVVGLLAAIWVWQNVHPLAGLVVGFLFVGGLGWKMLGFLVGLMRPSAKHAYGARGAEFISAWEQRFGELVPGGMNHPPSGTFQRWLKEAKRTGIPAGEWIDRQLGVSLPSLVETVDMLQSMPETQVGPPTWITAYCEVLTKESNRVNYPQRMVLDVDEEGLTVSGRSGDPSFDLEWDDVDAWEEMRGSESGESVWLLTLDAESLAVPLDVWGLKVTGVDRNDRQRWERYLRIISDQEQHAWGAKEEEREQAAEATRKVERENAICYYCERPNHVGTISTGARAWFLIQKADEEGVRRWTCPRGEHMRYKPGDESAG